ncbi:helix-turn-helix transcriptional regulator [Solibacillus sp. FSL H8-0523]|uniref:helix-turn-helix domain-containing protein n=1 Tax=Solibacillus sp. FSL H8-0523 TaxID=2954511 RepID=UPI0031012324
MLGKELRKWRKQANLSQEEMADELSIARSAISKIENDMQKIDILLFKDWVRLTNSEVQAAIILFGTDIFAQATQAITLLPAFAQPITQFFM